MSRRGFTIIELLAVFAIIAVLATLAMPKLTDATRKATAAKVIGDVNAIRHAAFDVNGATGSWPATGAEGQAPPAMVNSLPGGFQFTEGSVTYRWRSWALPDGLPGSPSDSVLVGVEVSTSDEGLMASIKRLYRGPLAFGTSTRVTFVVQ